VLNTDNLQKKLSSLVKSAKALHKSTTLKDRLKYLDAIQTHLELLDIQTLKDGIRTEQEDTKRKLSSSMSGRREEISNRAKLAKLPYQRLGEIDRVDIFNLHYSGEVVEIKLGNLPRSSLIDADGQKTVDNLLQLRKELQSMCLPRERFFKCIRASMAMATADGKATGGKVAVRELFPYLALRRQLESDRFLKRPEAKHFKEYSLADFAVELMTFGQDPALGWECEGQRLSNQTPAMVTQDRAIQLPDSRLTQVHLLWIE